MFIRLTQTEYYHDDPGTEILLNPGSIAFIVKSTRGVMEYDADKDAGVWKEFGFTNIHLNDGSYVEVKESYEEVSKIIEQVAFVYLGRI